MVVGPVSATDPSYEGTAPLFARFLRPRYEENDWNNPDTIEGLAGRFYFDVQMRDKNTWQKMPPFWIRADKPLPNWANTLSGKRRQNPHCFPVCVGRRGAHCNHSNCNHCRKGADCFGGALIPTTHRSRSNT